MSATQTNVEFERGLPGLSSAKLYQYLSEICRMGTIWPGSPVEVEVRDYFYEKFNSAGLQNVRTEAFEYRNYKPISSQLAIIAPLTKNLTCEPLEYSANGELEGEIIYVGLGSEADFTAMAQSGADFQGKIVMAKTNWSYFAYPQAEKWGAAGVIIVTDAPDRLIRYNSARYGLRDGESMQQYEGSIPGVLIPVEEADTLWCLLSLGPVRVRLSHEGKFTMSVSWNVVGEVSGTISPEKKVAIGSHYDTQLAGGAWDNAVGGAGLLELARVMAPLHPRRTVVFCAFSCEEVGLLGSAAYVERHQSDMTNYVAYINLDSTSAATAPIHQLFVTSKIRDFALRTIQKELNWRIDKFQDITPKEYFCDYVAFLKQGVEIIWASEQGNPYFHTKGDTIEMIDPERLNIATAANGLCLFKLAYMKDLPFPAEKN